MFNLDPGKLLVIAVVAIILLGPDRLPQVARQVGGAWRSFNEFRHRMESEVRNSMPDLPSTSEIARLARSPSALLNHLSNMSPEDETPAADATSLNGETAGDGVTAGDRVTTHADSVTAHADSVKPVGGIVGPAFGDAAAADTVGEPPTAGDQPSASPSPVAGPRSPEVIVPGDPTLN